MLVAKEEKGPRAGKAAELADWLLEIQERLETLGYGRIVIVVYQNQITGISVTHDIRKPARARAAKPPAPASGDP
jgi:hypothetical protein